MSLICDFGFNVVVVLIVVLRSRDEVDADFNVVGTRVVSASLAARGRKVVVVVVRCCLMTSEHVWQHLDKISGSS